MRGSPKVHERATKSAVVSDQQLGKGEARSIVTEGGVPLVRFALCKYV